jgi:hypothetical protein
MQTEVLKANLVAMSSSWNNPVKDMTPLSVQFTIRLILLELRTDGVLVDAKTARSFGKAENSTGTSLALEAKHLRASPFPRSLCSDQRRRRTGILERDRALTSRHVLH